MTENKPWKGRFFTITIGQTISLVGSSAVQFALIWWMAEKTASPLILSVAGLVAFLPQLLLGPFAGVWIDRWRRKRVVMFSDLFIGLVSAVFALYFAAGGNPPVWIVCLVLGLRAVGGVFHGPAIQALIPLLVPQERLMQANGWGQFMQSGAFMLGPALGSLLYTVSPMWVVLLTDLMGALAAVGTVASIQIEEPGSSGADYPKFSEEFRQGVAVFRGEPRLLRLLAAAAVCMLFFMPLSSLYPLMTSSYFSLGSAYGSFVEVVFAAGMMGSALLMSRTKGKRDRLLIALAGLFGLGLSTIVCGVLPPQRLWFWIFAVACAGMGACSNVYGIPIMTYMQERIPPEKMGRAFSLMSSVMSLTMPLGLVLAGPCAERWGVEGWFLFSGVAMLATAVVAAPALWRTRMGIDSKAA